MTKHNNQLAYRYIPGSLGTDCSLDNGAVMSEEFRLRRSRDRRLEQLLADPRVQWAKATVSSRNSSVSYNGQTPQTPFNGRLY